VTLLQPWGLALLLLALPLVAIYLLRGNPRRELTTAAFLWRGLEQQLTARRRWRRPPRSLALLLQLLALAAAVCALAQPALDARSSRQTVYLLDASASMLATDVKPNRFEFARAAIKTELESWQAGDRATLILIGAQPRVLVANAEPAALTRALAAARAVEPSANLRDALAIAGRHLQLPLGQGSEVVVFSDGTLSEPAGLERLAAPVRFVAVGTRGANQGVSSLQVRRGGGDAARFAGFASLTNYDTTNVRLPVRLLADGLPLETRLVDVPARGRAELPFEVPPTARSVAVALGGSDDLSLDDRAEISVPENRRRSALLVSRTPQAWQQALSVIPGLDVVVQSPDAYHDLGSELVVLDGFLPPRLPGGQLLVVNPPSGNGLVRVLGDVRDAPVSSYDAQDPLLRALDLGAIRLVKASRLSIPPWASSVAETAAGPLVLRGALDGRRVAVLGFDPLVSGLEKLVTFPLLVSNAVEYLSGSGADPAVPLGQPLLLPVAPDAAEVVLELPDGSRRSLSTGSGVAWLDDLDQVGRYNLRQRLAGGAQSQRTFFVDLFGESEADTAPHAYAAWPGASSELAAQQPGPPLWPLFVAAALLLLSLEWLHALRRG
jgi:Ca-activated chloride channel homolog